MKIHVLDSVYLIIEFKVVPLTAISSPIVSEAVVHKQLTVCWNWNTCVKGDGPRVQIFAREDVAAWPTNGRFVDSSEQGGDC